MERVKAEIGIRQNTVKWLDGTLSWEPEHDLTNAREQSGAIFGGGSAIPQYIANVCSNIAIDREYPHPVSKGGREVLVPFTTQHLVSERVGVSEP